MNTVNWSERKNTVQFEFMSPWHIKTGFILHEHFFAFRVFLAVFFVLVLCRFLGCELSTTQCDIYGCFGTFVSSKTFFCNLSPRKKRSSSKQKPKMGTENFMEGNPFFSTLKNIPGINQSWIRASCESMPQKFGGFDMSR